MVELGFDGTGLCNIGTPLFAAAVLVEAPRLWRPGVIRWITGAATFGPAGPAAVAGFPDVCIAMVESAIIGSAATRATVRLRRLVCRPSRMTQKTMATRAASWSACRRARLI